MDFSKAFDKIDRDALLYKLSLGDAPRSFIKIVFDFYNKMKSGVQNYSENDIISKLGVQQGHVWSPSLFSLYISDLSLALEEQGAGYGRLGGEKVFLLSYADDIILIAADAIGLQSSIDILSNYCHSWNLTVNIAKTKTMIFRNPGPLKLGDVFFYDGQPLEIVDSFKYLGLMLSATGVTAKMTDARAAQATKAKYALTSKLRNFNLGIKSKFALFDC